MAPWCVPLISALSCVVLFLPGGNGAVKLYFYVNTYPVQNATNCSLPQGTTARLSCQYDPIFHQQPVIIEVNHEGLKISEFHVEPYTDPQSNVYVQYTVPANQAISQHIYRCVQSNVIFIQVTITFEGGQATTNSPTTPTTPPTSPTSRRTIPPPTGTGGNQPQFAGLNPLIYTISAVILLGTLAIVAIITCWIRARRSFNSRLLRSNNTPQDYLDYISDNEFTPMTTSEFLASLQERPPTYNESEQIQSNTGDQSTREGGGESSDDPPANQGQQQRSARATTSSEDGGSREPSRTSVAAGTGSSNSGASSSRQRDSGRSNKTQERRTLPVVGILVDVEVDEPVQSENVTQQRPDCLTPTQDQISEIEATVGAVNERMRLIHERERQLNLRLEDSNKEEEDSITGGSSPLEMEGTPLLDIQM